MATSSRGWSKAVAALARPCGVGVMVSLLACASACAGSEGGGSTISSAGFQVTFAPECYEGDLALRATIENVTAAPLVINRGVPPWDYGPQGTRFSAQTRDIVLQKKSLFPLKGRTGPLVLAPGESRSGIVHIGLIFPTMSEQLKRDPVGIEWQYEIDRATDAGVVRGSLTLTKNPCVSR